MRPATICSGVNLFDRLGGLAKLYLGQMGLAVTVQPEARRCLSNTSADSWSAASSLTPSWSVVGIDARQWILFRQHEQLALDCLCRLRLPFFLRIQSHSWICIEYFLGGAQPCSCGVGCCDGIGTGAVVPNCRLAFVFGLFLFLGFFLFFLACHSPPPPPPPQVSHDSVSMSLASHCGVPSVS